MARESNPLQVLCKCFAFSLQLLYKFVGLLVFTIMYYLSDLFASFYIASLVNILPWLAWVYCKPFAIAFVIIDSLLKLKVEVANINKQLVCKCFTTVSAATH